MMRSRGRTVKVRRGSAARGRMVRRWELAGEAGHAERHSAGVRKLRRQTKLWEEGMAASAESGIAGDSGRAFPEGPATVAGVESAASSADAALPLACCDVQSGLDPVTHGYHGYRKEEGQPAL